MTVRSKGSVPDSSGSIARLEQAAKRAKDEGDLSQATGGSRPLKDGLGRIPKAAAPRMTAAEQSAEFERVAREHGAEGDEGAFNDTLRKLAKPRRN